MTEAAELLPSCIVFTQMELVGSRVTCNPPPANTDLDILVFCSEDEFDNNISKLVEEEWNHCGGDTRSGGDESESFRKGEVNIIITCCQKEFDSFMLATRLAKRFNLLDKSDRIALFEAVMYGRDVDDDNEV